MITTMVAAGLLVGLASSTALAGSGASVGGSAKAVYNAIPASVSANVPSVGFEATGTNEFGDAVGLASSARTLQSMSVLLSSFGCASGHWNTSDCLTTKGATFPVALTFTIYKIDGTTVLAQEQQTFDVLYRPSADFTHCTAADAGKWYNASDKSCNNGLPQLFKMSFPAGITLDDQVIWTVAYNTTHYGHSPLTEQAVCYSTAAGCGYDSLNVGAKSYTNAPFAGTDLDADEAFVNGAPESGWTGFRPLASISASR
jgi:hypothetical protein